MCPEYWHEQPYHPIPPQNENSYPHWCGFIKSQGKPQVLVLSRDNSGTCFCEPQPYFPFFNISLVVAVWLWVKTNGIPFWLVGECTTHFRLYFSGWIGLFTAG